MHTAIFTDIIDVSISDTLMDTKGDSYMKKIFYFLLFACSPFLIQNAQAAETSVFNDGDSFIVARSVKIGRERAAGGAGFSTIATGSSGGAKAEVAKLCDKNCKSCDTTTGTCQQCTSGYRLFSNACVSCPGNASCNGSPDFACNSGYYKSGTSCLAEKKCDTNCTSCDKTTGTCSSCKNGYKLSYNTCEYVKTDADLTVDCVKYCGSGFTYDRPGAKLSGAERVCTKYPLSCGYKCTTGWNIDYLVKGTVYTCQTAIQNNPNSCTNTDAGGKGTYGADCLKYCGQGFSYDRPGAKMSGKERVCTKYPLKCGYNCTNGWDIDYLVQGTVYTCQTARQTAPAGGC